MRTIADSTKLRLAALAAAVAAALLGAGVAVLLSVPQPAQAQGVAPYIWDSSVAMTTINANDLETNITVVRNPATSDASDVTLTFTFRSETGNVNAAFRSLRRDVAVVSIDETQSGVSNFSENFDAQGLRSFSVEVESSVQSFDIVITRTAIRGNMILEPDYVGGFIILTTSGADPPRNTSPNLQIRDDDTVEFQVFAVDETPARRITAEDPLITVDNRGRNLEIRVVGGTIGDTVTVQPFGSIPRIGGSFSYTFSTARVEIPANSTVSQRFRASGTTGEDLIFDEDHSGFITASVRFMRYPSASGNRIMGSVSEVSFPEFIPVIRRDGENPDYGFYNSGGNALGPIILEEGESTPQLRVRTRNTNTFAGMTSRVDVNVPFDVLLTVVGATPADAAQIESSTAALVPSRGRTPQPDPMSRIVEVTFRDDDAYNGTRIVNLRVNASSTQSTLFARPGAFTSETLSVTVRDNDTPVVQLTEAGQDASGVHFRVGAAPGTPRIAGDLPVAIRIQSNSVDTSTVVVIPAGQDFETVTVMLRTDNVVAAMRNSVSITVMPDPAGVYQIQGTPSASQTANDPDVPEFGLRRTDGTAVTSLMLAEGAMSPPLEVYITNGVTINANTRITPVGASAMDSALLRGLSGAVIPSGMSASSDTVRIGAADNNIYQGGAQFSIGVTLGATAPNGIFSNPASFSAAMLTLTVTDNDRPRLEAVAAGHDGSAARFRVQPAAGAPSIGANLQVDLSANAPADLLAGTPPAVVEFMANQEFALVEIALEGDGVYNAPRNVSVTLDGSSGIYDVAGDAAVQAVADPDVPIVLLGNAAAVTLEGEAGTQDLVVRLDAASPLLNSDLQVGIDVDDPSGTLEGAGGGALPGSVTIGSGQSATTLTLQIVEDTTYEGGGNQVATVGIRTGAYSISDATGAVSTLTLTVPDDDSPLVEVEQEDQGSGVEVVTEEDGTQVLQVGEGRTTSFTFQTNYPENTVLSASLSAEGARHLTLISQSVTVDADGRVTVEVRTSSVARRQDVMLTLAAEMTLEPIVQQIRVDDEPEESQVFFITGVPQTGGAEPGAWLWLVAFAAAVLLAAGAVLSRRRLRA